jgi:hypothetical protein
MNPTSRASEESNPRRQPRQAKNPMNAMTTASTIIAGAV